MDGERVPGLMNLSEQWLVSELNRVRGELRTAREALDAAVRALTRFSWTGRGETHLIDCARAGRISLHADRPCDRDCAKMFPTPPASEPKP